MAIYSRTYIFVLMHRMIWGSWRGGAFRLILELKCNNFTKS